MTKSTITRERLEEIVSDPMINQGSEFAMMARMALAAMDSEPVGEVIERPCSGEMNTGMTYRLVKGLGEMESMPVGTKFYVAQPAPVVQCPFPCGWDNLNKLAIQDAALVARGLVEGELTTEAHRQAAISNNDRLLKVISACRAAMLQTKSLTSINPAPDLVSLQKKAESIIGNYPGIPDCWCRTCRPVVLNDMRFVVCPDCGNKRCPRANDHRNACTGSNEPGQEGSAYPDTLQEPKP
ncbi:TPA: hypothetical protein L9L55_001030 [Klebsiella quasipneumoniae subsp. quasipneumoniae]|nr:hypothetical protein [Klebsiella quasipneumoniae subsp. quasipneumoniae]